MYWGVFVAQWGKAGPVMRAPPVSLDQRPLAGRPKFCMMAGRQEPASRVVLPIRVHLLPFQPRAAVQGLFGDPHARPAALAGTRKMAYGTGHRR